MSAFRTCNLLEQPWQRLYISLEIHLCIDILDVHVGAEAPTFTGSSDLRALPSAFNAKAQISGAEALDVAAKALNFKAKAHSLHATAVHLSAKAERQKHRKIQSHVTKNQK